MNWFGYLLILAAYGALMFAAGWNAKPVPRRRGTIDLTERRW